MHHREFSSLDRRARTARAWLCATALTWVVSACGGGGSSSGSDAAATAQGEVATGVTSLAVALDANAQSQSVVATPAFHAAPIELDAPGNADRLDPTDSARVAPHRQLLPRSAQALSTKHLTLQTIQAARRARAQSVGGDVVPLASSQAVSTYTPAQIRAAYALPPLPMPGAALSAQQAAQLGAGQTIYVVTAMHDAAVVDELAAFNQQFGLPTCTVRQVPPTASLPLAPASGTCELAIVYATSTGALTTQPSAYDAAWATETAIDVQWAHATAPLARIVLIEAPEATVTTLANAIKLANVLGPGIVSMSFGAPEGGYMHALESSFAAGDMTYVAATGDSAASVLWPAVSANVVAVGGTTLSLGSGNTRSESAWSSSGGGLSAHVAAPGYQTNAVPGMGSVPRRVVADVAFNADPMSGQYTAVRAPGATAVSWVSAGGTSLATPQWAGLIAIANAQRALANKPSLSAPHTVLYGSIGSVPGVYASAFNDVTRGSNGACTLCAAHAGYDAVTGLGTPNASALIAALETAPAGGPAPLIAPATITGHIGTPLTFTASVTSAHPVTLALANAPAGMTIAASGTVTWNSPIAGDHQVTIAATDATTGAIGQGTYNVHVVPAAAPVVADANIAGHTGSALVFGIGYAPPGVHAVSYQIAGAPNGMTVDADTGMVQWPTPRVGTYSVTATVHDSVTGLTGSGTYTIIITALPASLAGPAIEAAAMTADAGATAAGSIVLSDATSTSLTLSIAGAPLGMTFTLTGMTLNVQWRGAVPGTYMLRVRAVDDAGLTASTSVPVVVSGR